MGNQVDNKFTWIIKNFSSLNRKIIYSDQFFIGGYKWHILAYPKGKTGNDKSFCLDLELVDCESLPSGWRRTVKFSFTLVNYFSKKLSKEIGLTHWFDHKEQSRGLSMIHLSRLADKQCGFLVDGEVEIVAQINVFENDRKFDVPKDYDMVTTSLKIIKPNDDGAMSSNLHKEADLVYVNGFQVLPSQVSIVRRIFEKQPETALECCTKNQDLRTSYINVLFSLIKMLYKVPPKHSTDDLSDAEAALAYMKNVGFKLDWLEKKLDEVKEHKKKCSRVSDLEQQLKDLMNKYTGVSKQLEKERAENKKAAAHDPFAVQCSGLCSLIRVICFNLRR